MSWLRLMEWIGGLWALQRQWLRPRKRTSTNSTNNSNSIKQKKENGANNSTKERQLNKSINLFDELVSGVELSWFAEWRTKGLPPRGKSINSLFFLLSRCARQKRRKELNGRGAQTHSSILNQSSCCSISLPLFHKEKKRLDCLIDGIEWMNIITVRCKILN